MPVNSYPSTAPIKSLTGLQGEPGLTFVGDTNAGFFTASADRIVLTTDGAGRLSVDSTGRVLIGQLTSTITSGALVQVTGNSSSLTSFGVLGIGRGTEAQSIVSGDQIGQIAFTDSLGGSFATIGAQADGSTGVGDMPGRLVFSTTPDGSASPSERMRIDGSGRVGIGTSNLVQNFTIGSTSPPIQRLQRTGLADGNSSDTGALEFANGTGAVVELRGRGNGNILLNSRALSTDSYSTRILIGGSTGRIGIATGTLSGGVTVAFASEASLPSTILNGTWFSGGSGATTKPHFLIEPDGTTSTGWSTAGTGLGVNAATGFTGRLLDLQLNGVSQFSVSSSGRVSIPLGTAALPSIYPGTDTNTGIWSPGADLLAFSTNGTERARFDTAGTFMVGTTTLRGTFIDGATTPLVQVESTNSSASLSVVRGGGEPYLILGRSGAASLGSNTIITTGSALGRLTFAGTDGTNIRRSAAEVAAVSTDTPASGSIPGALVFRTTNPAAADPTEKARIDSSGRFLLGLTSATVTSSFIAVANSASSTGQGIIYLSRGQTNPTANNTLGQLFFSDNVQSPGAIVQAAADASWGASSFPSRLVFLTTASAASTATERMRIDSAGQVGIGTTGALSAGLTVALAGAASAPATTLTGAWFSGGTGTTTKPQLLVEASGAVSTGWSTAGTGFGVNAASGFTGRLLDLQLNGVSNFNVDSTGRVSVPLGTAALPAIYPGTDTNTGIYSPGADQVSITTAGTQKFTIDSFDGNPIVETAYPDVMPTLDLAFALTKTLDPRVTFSRASTGTYVGADGLIKTAAVNEARFDHNSATAQCLGLLVEEQRTNLLARSEGFNDSIWVKTQISILPNSTLSPNGLITATKLIENTVSTVTHHVQQVITPVASTVYTYSCFMRAAERTQGAVGFTGAGNSDSSVIFNLSNGSFVAVIGLAPTSYSITPFNNGWYRCSITWTASTTAAMAGRSMPASGGIITYTGDGVSGVHVWGAQLEVGASPTSYIPTPSTFTSRASTATFFDSTGTLQTAAIDVARSAAYLPDSNGVFRLAGLLLEDQRTNGIRNNTMAGAVTGTPGTLPNNWSANTTSNGITRTVVAAGTESGISYIDIRFQGTATAGFNVNIYPETTTAIPAVQSTTYIASFYIKLISGSTAGVTGSVFAAQNADAVGTSLAQFFTSALLQTAIMNGGPVTTALPLCRYTFSGSFASASTAYWRPYLQFTITNGAAIDFTVRVGMPQAETGSFATSVIPTTTTALTRSADVSSSATVTRSADVTQITGTNFTSWYNQDEGTLFAEILNGLGGLGVTANNAYFGVSNGALSAALSTGDGIKYGSGSPSTSTRVFVVSGGATSFDNNSATNASKVAIAYKQDNFAIARASVLGTDTSGTVPSGMNRFTILGQGTMTYSRLTFWPFRLSDIIVQTITR